jgi:hypothetical protein
MYNVCVCVSGLQQSNATLMTMYSVCVCVPGLQQSNAILKDHMKQVEEVLAGRESSLQELSSCLERTNKERETEQQDYLRRIQDLELSLKKEKDGSRDLRKQVKKCVCVCGVCVFACVCVRACVRACVRGVCVCVRACMHVVCR